MTAPYYQHDGITLYCGDCLTIMPELEAQSIDAIICDPPYGTTACSWDSVIPFDAMWANVKRLLRPRGAVVLFGSEPFSSALRMSNIGWYKYDWIWKKSKGAGFLNASNAPIKNHEVVSVFSFGTIANCSPLRMEYNPQGLKRIDVIKERRQDKNAVVGNRPSRNGLYTQEYANYPNSILDYPNDSSGIHPTQKPLDLMRYLVRTYTNAGDTVLDFTSGSGTTLEAALIEGRRCIGIEQDTGYCDYTVRRLRGERERTITIAGEQAKAVQANLFNQEAA